MTSLWPLAVVVGFALGYIIGSLVERSMWEDRLKAERELKLQRARERKR